MIVNLDVSGRRTVVVGGGQVAEAKVRKLLEAGAAVTVISPVLTTALAAYAAGGRITAHRRPFAPGDTEGAFLTVAATGRPEVDAAVAAEAQAAGRLVTVSASGEADRGNVTFTAEVQRGSITVAVSTGGASPALARRVRAAVERAVGPEYATLANWLAEARERLTAGSDLTQAGRAAIYRAVVEGPVLELLAAGETAEARRRFEEMLRT